MVSKEWTCSEVAKRKDKLQDDIARLVQEFHKETGMECVSGNIIPCFGVNSYGVTYVKNFDVKLQVSI